MTTEAVDNGGNGAVDPAVNAAALKELEKLYPFDAPVVIVDVPMGKGVVLQHVLEKPMLEHYQDREDGVVRRTRVGKDNTQTPDNDDNEANCEFYDTLIQEATANKRDVDTGKDEKLKSFTAEECRAFVFEQKVRAVVRMQNSWYEVEERGWEEALFEREGTLRVRQEIGEEGKPSYVVTYVLDIPKKSERLDYLKGSFSTERKQGKRNNVTIETKLNLRKGVKIFDKLFRGVEGGRLDRGAYDDSLRDDFLKQIDSMFKVGVVDTIVGHFDQGRD